jgi:hypothetical protein
MTLETAARTGPAGQGVRQAELAIADHRVADALQQYTQLIAATNLDNRSARFIQQRIARLQMEQQLASGQSVDFLPASDDDPNWTAARGTYVKMPDGSIEVKSGPTGSAIYCHTPVGQRFEVTGEFDVVQTSSGAFQAGLLIGWPNPDSSQYWGFRIKHNHDEGDVVEYARNWTLQGLKTAAAVKPDHNTFTYQFDNGVAAASINGEAVMRHQKKPGNILVRDDEFALGLGAYNDMNTTTIRYRNVKLLRLGVK